MPFPIDPLLASSTHQEFSDHGQLANLLHAVNSTTEQEQEQEQEQAASAPLQSDASPSRKRQRQSSASREDSNRTKPPLDTAAGLTPAPVSYVGSSASSVDAAATVLFRKQPREPAKKSTRPLSKEVFTSLKLTTEDWVKLEAEAKDYMLDEAHPERQACVGQRANVTANDTKLQLFKTVQQFLVNGAGLHFFGRSDDDDPGSKWVYPRDEDRLILLMTPLMRRMVTNERQRKYAYRTRHSDRGKSIEAATKVGDAEMLRNESRYSSAPNLEHDGPTRSILPISVPASSALDLGLDSFHVVFLDREKVVHRSVYPSEYMRNMSFQNLIGIVQEQLNEITFNMIDTSLPVNIEPEDNGTDPTAEYVRRNALQLAAAAAAAQVPVQFEMFAHLRDGLQRINGEEDWDLVKAQVRETAWMVGCMKLLVSILDGAGDEAA